MTEHPPAELPRIGRPLLKASLVASLLFGLAWFRWPLSVGAPKVLVMAVFFGVPITAIAMLVGFPLAHLLWKLKARWWAYLLVGAAIGASCGAMTSRPYVARPDPPPGVDAPIENPHFLTVSPSPFTRDFALDEMHRATDSDYRGAIVFCAVIGGSLGMSFWFFSRRRKDPLVRAA